MTEPMFEHDGRTLNHTTYAKLYAAIGARPRWYVRMWRWVLVVLRVRERPTTFKLPDFRERGRA